VIIWVLEFFIWRSVRVKERLKPNKGERSGCRRMRGARRRCVRELASHSSQRRGSKMRAAEGNSNFGFKGNFKNYGFIKTRFSIKWETSRGQAAGAENFIRAAKYF
jgi:hypothetical protein